MTLKINWNELNCTTLNHKYLGMGDNCLNNGTDFRRTYTFCSIHWFLVCYAATQLAAPLHQRRIQVVRSNKVARKRLTESNGTPAMDLGHSVHINVVLKEYYFYVCLGFYVFVLWSRPERWPQVCRVKIKFTLLLIIGFVSTTTNSMKCLVNWIPLDYARSSLLFQKSNFKGPSFR